MATAYKCDLDGKLYEGTGTGQMEIDVSENCRLRVVPFGKNKGGAFAQGVICPDQAAFIKDALQKAFGYTPPVVDRPSPVEPKK